jgi:hypothetical protein
MKFSVKLKKLWKNLEVHRTFKHEPTDATPAYSFDPRAEERNW